MDVLDAGVYLYKFVAAVPKGLKIVLWGPLQAKEMGFSDWDYQDGGETGFIYHSSARAVKMGLAHASLIHVRRHQRAYLTIYLAGYPSDAAKEQRLIDVRGLVNEAELFLTKLAGETVRFELSDERAVVENAGPTRNPPSGSPAVAALRVGRKGPLWEI